MKRAGNPESDAIEDRLRAEILARGRVARSLIAHRVALDAEPGAGEKVADAVFDSVVGDRDYALLVRATANLSDPIEESLLEAEAATDDGAVRFTLSKVFEERLQAAWVTTVVGVLPTAFARKAFVTLWERPGVLAVAADDVLTRSGPTRNVPFTCAGILRRLVDSRTDFLVKRSDGLGAFCFTDGRRATPSIARLRQALGLGDVKLLVVGASPNDVDDVERPVRANPATVVRIRGENVKFVGERSPDGALRVILVGAPPGIAFRAKDARGRDVGALRSVDEDGRGVIELEDNTLTLVYVEHDAGAGKGRRAARVRLPSNKR